MVLYKIERLSVDYYDYNEDTSVSWTTLALFDTYQKAAFALGHFYQECLQYYLNKGVTETYNVTMEMDMDEGLKVTVSNGDGEYEYSICKVNICPNYENIYW